MKENLNDIRLSPHFMLGEFINQQKYADNIPTMQAVVNLTYGCHMLLEPARQLVMLPFEHIAMALAADDVLGVGA